MKAARLYSAGEPLVIEDVPEISPGAGEVKIKVKVCGICGSDLHMQQGVIPTFKLPLVLGHEASGEVVEVGDGVKQWKTGDRVVAVPAITCNHCRYCRLGRPSLCRNIQMLGTTVDGAMAEYLVVPSTSLVELPREISYEEGALSSDAVATPYHALLCQANLKAAEKVAVIGCGGLGSHAVKLSLLLGASTVAAIDLSADARERAERWGASVAVEPLKENLKSLIDEGHGPFDVIIDFVGSQESLANAFRIAAAGARIAVVGLSPAPLSGGRLSGLVSTELNIMGSFGAHPRDVEQVLDFARRGRFSLKESIDKTFSLDEINDALSEMEKRRGQYVRYVIKF